MRRLSYIKRSFAVGLAVASVVACDSAAPRGPGAIRVATSSQLSEPFFFVYGVSVDSGTPRLVSSGQSFTFLTTGLAHGRHAVTVDSVPTICTGANRVEVELRGDDTASVIIALTCARVTGDIRVTVATTGTDLDPNGYIVLLDQLQMAIAPVNGNVTVPFVFTGSHSVGLAGVASNCTASGTQNVNVVAGALSTASFTVTCAPIATIRLVTSASGTERDPDGLTIAVDGGAAVRAPLTGTLNTTTSAGTHNYVIGDIAPNCTLGVPASGSVTLAQGELVTINAALTCADVGYGVAGVVHTDPTSDTLANAGNNSSAAHDVRTVSGRYVSGWLLVVLRFGRPPGSSAGGSATGLHGIMDFDSDENSGTGGAPFVNAFGGSATQGSDYAIDLFDTDSVSAAIYRFTTNGGALVGRVRTKFEGDSVVIQIPLNKVAGDDGNMTISGVLGTQDRPTDIFPNAGVVISHAPTGPVVADRGTPAAVRGAAVAPSKRPTVIQRPGKWKVPR